MNWASVPIVSRLLKRFVIQKPPYNIAEAIPLLGAIQPITNVDNLLRETKIESLYSADPGGVALIKVHTVPSGKKQTFRAIQINKVSGATLTTSYVSAKITATVPIEEYTAAAAHSYYLPEPLPLPEGAEIHVGVAAYTAGDIMAVKAIYDEEDSY